MGKVLRILGRIATSPFRALRSMFGSTRELLFEQPDDTPLLGVIEKTFAQPSDLLEHVVDLRKRLLWAVLGLALTTGISFTFAPRIIDLLASPIGGMNELVAIDVTEPISVFMRVSLLSGFALALPWIAFQIWLFAAPGLMLRTRWSTLFSIPLVVLFFLGGMFFSYQVLLPTALPYLLSFMGITTIPRPASYISFVTGLLFWVGIAFEFPFVIFILARLGFVKATTLAKQWRLAIVIIAIAAAAITPTVDPVNMSLLMGPLLVLYALSVLLAFLAQGARRKEEKRKEQASQL